MTGTESVVIPGGRDVRATLDTVSGTEGSRPGHARPRVQDTEACVVACPPHPQHRGHRNDSRLTAISDAVVERGIDCLRFDYGDWDEGYGELADAKQAVVWAQDRYTRVAVYGYSFGGCLSILVGRDTPVKAVAALAPPARLTPDLDAVSAIEAVTCPVQVVYGSRDETASWQPVVDRARSLGHTTVQLSADHFFIGQTRKVGRTVGEWLEKRLLDDY